MASPPAPDPFGPGPELPAPTPDAPPAAGGAGMIGAGTGDGAGVVGTEETGRQKPGSGAGDLPAALAGLPPEVAELVLAAAGAGQPVSDAVSDGGRPRRRSRTSPDRVQRSFYLPRDLVDRARAAVSATMRRPGEAYNISQLAGRALENEVRRLERLYNGGEPFPPVAHVRSGPSPEGVERIRTGVTVPRRRRA